MKTIREMIEERARALNVMRDLQKRSKDENRLMTEDENQQWDKANNDFQALTRAIEQAETMKANESLIEKEERKVAGQDAPAKPLDYRSVWEKYARWGMTSLSAEERALIGTKKAEYRGTDPQTTTVGTGGYTIPEDFSGQLELTMAQWGGMLNACTILNTASGATLPWPVVDDTAATASLQTEGTAIAVLDFDDTEVSYGAYTLGSLIEVSEQLLQDTGVPLEQAIGEMLGRRLGVTWNTYFTTGTGSSQPTGLLAASNGTSKGADAGATAITRDNLIDLKHSVDPAYRLGDRVGFMFNDSTLSYIIKLSDANDNFLWVPSMREGEPDRILGYRYWINQQMPDVATGQKSVVFGDFSKYIIRTVGNMTMRRLTERYAEKLNVGFLAWQRADGKLLQTAALKHLLHA